MFQLNKVGISIVIQAQHIAQTASSARQFQFVIVGFLGLQVSVGQYDERWPRAIILEKLLLRVGHAEAGRELIRRVEPLAVGIRGDDQERNAPFGVANGREIHGSTLHVLQQIVDVSAASSVIAGIVCGAEEVVSCSEFHR